MKLKITIFLTLVLVLLSCMSFSAFAEGTEPWAEGETPSSTQIFYIAEEKVEPTGQASYPYGVVFEYNSEASTFDENSGKGIMVFDSEITEIPYEAFMGNWNLTKMILPASVTSLGDINAGRVFTGCGSLDSVSMPGVTYIGSETFAECGNLKNVYMPEVLTVSASAFDGCALLEEVSMPKVQTLGSNVFGNTSVKKIYIPKVESFYEVNNEEEMTPTFSNCFNLQYIYVPESIGTDIAVYSLDEESTLFSLYPVTLSSTNGTIAIDGAEFTEVDGCKTYLATGTIYTLTTTANAGYELDTLVFSGNGIIATDIKTSKSFTIPSKAVTITATYTQNSNNNVFLDLEDSNTYEDNKEIEQKYTFKQTNEKFTGTTKVKLEWVVNDLVATYSSEKTWDAENLVWTEVKKDIDVSSKGATFTITNYSSSAVIANVQFAVETSLAETFDSATFDNNDCTVETPVKKDTQTTYTDADFSALKQTITASLTLKNAKFADLSATTSQTKYGTYTVTISAAPAITANYLTFTANQDNSSVTPQFVSGTWQYSTNDGKTWIDGTNDGTTTITLTNAGDKVMLKGTNCITDDYNHFSMTGSIAASGDVTSLTNGIGGDIALIDSCYQCMFYECGSLTSAPNLPSTTLAEYCYCNMFYNCESLTTAPALPATTLAEACYMFMFSNCESLTTAPALPAGVNGVGSLAVECYYGMFTYCYKLENAPALGATTLTKGCYNAMFNSCTSLTYAPSLPATTLVSECYYQMFNGCTKLKVATSGSESNKIFTCPDTTGLEDPLPGMFDYTAGTFTGTPTTGTTYYWYTE